MSEDRSALPHQARPMHETAAGAASGRHVDEHGDGIVPGDVAGGRGTLDAATEVRAALDARWRAIGEEIRHYPTPIARCDVQLPALLDARDQVRRLREIDDDATLVAAYARALTGWSQS